MSLKQPLSAVFIDYLGATNVSHSMQDLDLVSKVPKQTVTASTDHEANVSPDPRVSKSSALHATANPSDFMVARSHMAPHEGVVASPRSESAGSPSFLSWANFVDSGEYIPKEALGLEKNYGGFTLNSKFLINQCAAPRRSSLYGRQEGRRSSGRGEWTARNMDASASTLQNVYDMSDKVVLQLPKSVSKPTQIAPACPSSSRMGADAPAAPNAQPSARSTPNHVQPAFVHQNPAEKATTPIKPAPPSDPLIARLLDCLVHINAHVTSCPPQPNLHTSAAIPTVPLSHSATGLLRP
ncbi:hypothetical protein F0562_034137 [Nyssa sinensis]|uniref:Uncharacterized protein n=1 Tax=Nyssa sinensis TaxID=561372 RepID=A0A5J5AFJ1_9ASTE|nr:hypothetical protein F0562_034137 [Nyssa sinensis]